MSEIDGTPALIPIASYPKQSTRRLLLQKQPRLWLDLLETWINIMRYYSVTFGEQNNKETDKNKSQDLISKSQSESLLGFVISYIEENQSLILEDELNFFTSDNNDNNQIDKLKPLISSKQYELRSWIFQLIGNHLLILNFDTNKNINIKFIWNFIKFYYEKNLKTIQNFIIKGNISSTSPSKNQSQLNNSSNANRSKSKFKNKNTNFIILYPLQKYISLLLKNNTFNRFDFQCLCSLFEWKQSITINNNNNNNNKKRQQKQSQFNEKFINKQWISNLQQIYTNDNNNNLDSKLFSKNLTIISLISISSYSINLLLKFLNINNFDTLKPNVLLYEILTNEEFKILKPDIGKYVGYLNISKIKKKQPKSANVNVSNNSASTNDINSILELFPQLSISQANTVLIQNNHNVEQATNYLLENQDAVIPETPITVYDSQNYEKIEESPYIHQQRSIYDTDDISNNDFSNISIIHGKRQQETELSKINEDTKSKTLTAALRLIYEADDDERDDTYDDAEVLKTSTNTKRNKNSNNNNSNVDEDIDDDDDDDDDKKQTSTSQYDKNEEFLWDLFKRDKSLFEKLSRKSKIRKDLKDSTKWSDEQIEGWGRMLLKEPRRMKFLEEKYLFQGNIPNRPRTKYRKTTILEDDDDDEGSDEEVDSRPSTSAATNTTSNTKSNSNTKPNTNNSKDDKRTYARNAQNKAKRANHNRKAGFAKKVSKAGI